MSEPPRERKPSLSRWIHSMSPKTRKNSAQFRAEYLPNSEVRENANVEEEASWQGGRLSASAEAKSPVAIPENEVTESVGFQRLTSPPRKPVGELSRMRSMSATLLTSSPVEASPKISLEETIWQLDLGGIPFEQVRKLAEKLETRLKDLRQLTAEALFYEDLKTRMWYWGHKAEHADGHGAHLQIDTLMNDEQPFLPNDFGHRLAWSIQLSPLASDYDEFVSTQKSGQKLKALAEEDVRCGRWVRRSEGDEGSDSTNDARYEDWNDFLYEFCVHHAKDMLQNPAQS